MASRILDGIERSPLEEAPLRRLLDVVTDGEGQALQRVHALWCAGHVGRLMGDSGVDGTLRSLYLDQAVLAALADPDPEVVVQALRVAAEREAVDFPGEALVLLLRGHPEPPRPAAWPPRPWGSAGACPPEPGGWPPSTSWSTSSSPRGPGDPWLRTAAHLRPRPHGGPRRRWSALADHPARPSSGSAPSSCSGASGDRRIATFLARCPRPPSGPRPPAGSTTRGCLAAMGALVRRAAASLMREVAITRPPIRRSLHARMPRGGDPRQRLAPARVRVGRGAPIAPLRAEALRVLASWTRPLTRDGVVMDHRPAPPRPQVGDLRLAATDVDARRVPSGRLTRSPLARRPRGGDGPARLPRRAWI